MNKYIVSLLISILVIACNTSSNITIPPGKYINKDGSIWSPGNTDTTKTYCLYYYHGDGKYRKIMTVVKK